MELRPRPAWLFAQTGVPAEIIKQMQAAVAEASKDPDVVARLAPLGTNVLAEPTEVFAKFLNDQRVLLTELIKDTGITLE